MGKNEKNKTEQNNGTHAFKMVSTCENKENMRMRMCVCVPKYVFQLWLKWFLKIVSQSQKSNEEP